MRKIASLMLKNTYNNKRSQLIREFVYAANKASNVSTTFKKQLELIRSKIKYTGNVSRFACIQQDCLAYYRLFQIGHNKK